ncbi:hypothetical protein Tco_0667757 [Tanacetum coccineum]
MKNLSRKANELRDLLMYQSEVALAEKDQLKEVRKKSLKDFHKIHPSGSGTVAARTHLLSQVKELNENDKQESKDESSEQENESEEQESDDSEQKENLND